MSSERFDAFRSPLTKWGAFPHSQPMLAAAENAMAELAQRGLANKTIPARADIFNAFDWCSPGALKVVILGQSPYPDPKEAMGLAFSSRLAKCPASLRNIYKEMISDIGSAPMGNDLSGWAKQGVLLANASMTLADDGREHPDVWCQFTSAWIECITQNKSVVWVLWGNWAKAFAPMISKHKPQIIIESAHPSPLSARRGFFGSQPFSKVNAALTSQGLDPIDWSGSGQFAKV